ncbi:MAG: glycosyltransferase 87 family protein [Nonlabens sp.]|uniref:glycosyltransferase 87 family protein n=2 Tax=Nonlabens sp. TaxID=1888209 RepID=UPI00321C252C
MKNKLGNILGIISLISIVLYAVFFSLPRKQFSEILLVYSLLFLGLYFFYKFTVSAFQQNFRFFPYKWSTRFFESDSLLFIFIAGLSFRLTLLTYTPNLSQDFFRFIWDGHQLLNGFNPYLYLPDNVIKNDFSHIPNATLLHANMGALSSSNYTNYPPFNQLLFAIAAFLGGKSITATIIWMRILVIAAEIGIFIYGIKLLQLLGKPPYLILLYFLNPFVIIELTGNLHFEGVMAFLMLLSVYFLLKSNYIKGALFLGYGILLKLLPVIALPLLIRRLWCRKAIVFYLVVSVVVISGFLPFFSVELMDKYSNSVGLWFGNFEFNASVYYIVRAIGYEITGYNIIETAGKVLPIITFLIIISISLFRKNELPEVLITSILFSYFVYLILSTTVHPWYLTIPLLFSVFTKYRFMLVWSCTVFLSYYTYSNSAFQENPWLIGVEYLIVLGYLLFEVFKKNNSRVLYE